MSRSFAILLSEARRSTPDPERPGKNLTQERLATILEINLGSIRHYEQGTRIPCPIIRRSIFNLFPCLTTTE